MLQHEVELMAFKLTLMEEKMARRKPNLNIVGVPEGLKKRLRIDAIRQGISPSKLAIEILDAALPKLEETDSNNNQNNGQTLRQQFERVQPHY